MILRNLDMFLYDKIRRSLSLYNFNNVHVVDSYPDQSISVPTVSIDFIKELDLPLELGKTINGNYYFILDIFARSDGERDDIITCLTAGLDQVKTTLDNGNIAVITEIKPIISYRPGQFISTSIFTRDYYYIDFDGYAGHGEMDHHIDYSNNTISIEIDFSCNQFITSGFGDAVTSNYYNISDDATIISYGSRNLEIINTGKHLSIFNDIGSDREERAYLVFNTNGLLDLSDINDVNLYFYVTSGVYSYRSNIYVLRDRSIPIDGQHWSSSKDQIGSIECTGEGWYTVNFGANCLSYINNDGYSIISIEPVTFGQYTNIAAFEYGSNNAYLEAIVGAILTYDTTCLVDKFDEDNFKGFKLWLDSTGGIYWTRGFVGSVLTTYVADAINLDTRYHLSVGSRYDNTIYDVQIFLNGELIGERHENWFILPVYTDDQIYIIANTYNNTITDFGDINLYGLRITQDYFETEPVKRGEYLDYGGDIDISCIPANEGYGEMAYDFKANNDMTLISGFKWFKYLSEEITGSAKTMSVATFRLKIEVAETR